LRVFLTGITGFLGASLARHWRERGHAVSGAAPDVEETAPHSIRYTLGRPIDPSALAGVDVIVHCAYDAAASYSTNYDGTILIYAAARKAAVARQILVSSYSARPDAASEYGRLKYALEQFFLSNAESVVRPGLVIGNGGLFGRNMRKILTSPVMPLLDGGRDQLPLIGIRDFTAAMTAILEGGRTGAFNLFDPCFVTMRTLVRTVNRAAGHRALYLPISATLAGALLSVCERCGIRLPVDRGNLRALKANQRPIHQSDLAGLVPTHATRTAIIQEAVAEFMGGRIKACRTGAIP
jgi:NADH dehydrogenase